MPDWFLFATNLLTPFEGSALLRAQAGVAGLAAVCLAAVCLLLPLVWKATGDLQSWTVVVAAVLVAAFGGILLLARSGHVLPAAGLLILLLAGLCTADIFYFGVSSLGGSAFVLPILLAEFCIGGGWGLAAAGLFVFLIWSNAIAETRRWLFHGRAPCREHLTFHAPALTLLLLLAAVLSAYWSFLLTFAML